MGLTQCSATALPVIHTSAVSMIMNIVNGTDVATKEGSKDVISLYPTARHRGDAVTE